MSILLLYETIIKAADYKKYIQACFIVSRKMKMDSSDDSWESYTTISFVPCFYKLKFYELLFITHLIM